MKQNAFYCVTLTDDIEYTVKCKEKVYFEKDVEVEDEKPESFIAGYRQRIRWMRGGFQVFFASWKNYDYRKYYLSIFSLANIYYTLLFIQLRLPKDIRGLLFFFGLFYLFNIFLYGSLLDMQDLKKLKFYDFITFPFFCLTSYPIVIWSLITWKSKKWYRPEHSGVRDGTKNLE
jgi:cellulose synthase/poly-beta-1,6-N-acetylglucosamine synthase-like glycosyltransferase